MYYFLVNPASKSGYGMSVWNKIQDHLNSNSIEYRAYFSKRAGHMKELMYDICSEHIDDEEKINVIILGGDGSFNEAIQGVISFDKVNIGYLPTGSSNDFARAVIYDKDPLSNLKRILACNEPLKFDIGMVRILGMSKERPRLVGAPATSTYYFNVSCGIGFDAAVCEEILESKAKKILNKLGLGKLVYTLIALKQVFSAKLCDAEIILDNSEKVEIKNCRLIVGMNTCYEGGGFKFAPAAIPTDGYLDICTAGNMNPLSVIMALPSAAKGNHVKFKKIHLYRAKEYEVKAQEPLWVHTDGEVNVKSNHIKVSVLKGGMSFLW